MDFSQNSTHLPNSIRYLNFDNLNRDTLPQSIINLNLSNNFNQNINRLPHSITHLTFGNNFNQNINILPDSITHLIFENTKSNGKELDEKIFEEITNDLLVKSDKLDTCSICMDDCEHQTICNHYFHKECLSKWLMKSKDHTCPNCRKELL